MTKKYLILGVTIIYLFSTLYLYYKYVNPVYIIDYVNFFLSLLAIPSFIVSFIAVADINELKKQIKNESVIKNILGIADEFDKNKFLNEAFKNNYKKIISVLEDLKYIIINDKSKSIIKTSLPKNAKEVYLFIKNTNFINISVDKYTKIFNNHSVSNTDIIDKLKLSSCFYKYENLNILLKDLEEICDFDKNFDYDKKFCEDKFKNLEQFLKFCEFLIFYYKKFPDSNEIQLESLNQALNDMVKVSANDTQFESSNPIESAERIDED